MVCILGLFFSNFKISPFWLFSSVGSLSNLLLPSPVFPSPLMSLLLCPGLTCTLPGLLPTAFHPVLLVGSACVQTCFFPFKLLCPVCLLRRLILHVQRPVRCWAARHWILFKGRNEEASEQKAEPGHYLTQCYKRHQNELWASAIPFRNTSEFSCIQAGAF